MTTENSESQKSGNSPAFKERPPASHPTHTTNAQITTSVYRTSTCNAIKRPVTGKKNACLAASVQATSFTAISTAARKVTPTRQSHANTSADARPAETNPVQGSITVHLEPATTRPPARHRISGQNPQAVVTQETKVSECRSMAQTARQNAAFIKGCAQGEAARAGCDC